MLPLMVTTVKGVKLRRACAAVGSELPLEKRLIIGTLFALL